MNKSGKEQLTLGALVLGILLFIGFCLMAIWALSDAPSNEVNDDAIGVAWNLIGWGVLFLILIVLIVVLAILANKAKG